MGICDTANERYLQTAKAGISTRAGSKAAVSRGKKESAIKNKGDV